jgi:predicted SnoaL-like aldol condensation-catalyzing enzyme
MAYSEQEQANLDRVLTMYQEVLVAMNPDAVDDHLPPHYIQHSLLAAPGLGPLKEFLAKVREQSPDAKQTIHRAFADDDHVMFMSMSSAGPMIRVWRWLTYSVAKMTKLSNIGMLFRKFPQNLSTKTGYSDHAFQRKIGCRAGWQ